MFGKRLFGWGSGMVMFSALVLWAMADVRQHETLPEQPCPHELCRHHDQQHQLAHPHPHAHDDTHQHAHDHEHHHGPHGHTHLPVDYSLHGVSDDYTPPKPDEDGYYWWRGNLHTHTLWSDGDAFPEVVADWYKKHGYHFLALSDHNILSRGQGEGQFSTDAFTIDGKRWIKPAGSRYARSGRGVRTYEIYEERFGEDWVETMLDEHGDLLVRLKPLQEFRPLFEQPGRFLLIESEEITDHMAVHVNATNILEFIPPQGGSSVTETIERNVQAVLEQRQRTGQPMFPHLNHPNWNSAITAEEMMVVEDLKFFEVYNGHRGVRNFGQGNLKHLDRVWDIMLTRRLGELGYGVLYGLAVDDAHHYDDTTSEVAQPGRGWVMVRSKFLTPEHLIAAMESGDFYASNGVTLRKIERTDEHISIEIEPEEGVTYITQFIGTRLGYDAGSEPVLDFARAGKIADVTDRWVFVQAVADRDEGEQTLRVYDRDNDRWHEATIDLPRGSTNPTGQLSMPSHVNNHRYQGQMAEIHFWHRSRTRDEAEADMNRRLRGNESGLVGYWRFGDAEQVVRDGAGEHHARILHSTLADATIAGSNRVLVADGQSSHGMVDQRDGLVPGDSSFTIEMWVKTDSSANGWSLPLEWVGGDRVYVGQDVGSGWNFVVTTDGQRTDTQNGRGGEPVEVRATRRYSAEIGQVFEQVEGTSASYTFEGDEIYVRAKVISSKLKRNPFARGEREKAWVQPVVLEREE